MHIPHMVKPLLARCLRRSATLALSVTSRGLFLAKARKAEIWRSSEKWVCTAFFLFTLACGSAKILYALSKEGFYYGALRMVYDCAKMYL